MNKRRRIREATYLVLLAICLAFLPGHSFAQSNTAFDNANCNASFLRYCDDGEPPEDDPTPLEHPPSGTNNAREWDKGYDAFPGNTTGADNTVAWMSGRTNAVFAAPAPELGGGIIGWIIGGLFGLMALTYRFEKPLRKRSSSE